MLKAGLQNEHITFLFVDTQVNNSIFLLPATVYWIGVVLLKGHWNIVVLLALTFAQNAQEHKWKTLNVYVSNVPY